jgi:hypothetical protein
MAVDSARHLKAPMNRSIPSWHAIGPNGLQFGVLEFIPALRWKLLDVSANRDRQQKSIQLRNHSGPLGIALQF